MIAWILRYVDDARDEALRAAGLAATGEKLASGSTVRQMQKNLIDKLQKQGFMTVQYGSGERAYQVSLDAYAEMVARSTTREAGNMARETQLKENGYDLMKMSVHFPTCEVCARLQGRVYSISGEDKRFPSIVRVYRNGYRNVHPNCRHIMAPFIEEFRTEDEMQTEIAESNKPFVDPRPEVEKKLYNEEQAKNRRIRQDRYQYERYKARLGEDAPKSFSAFRRMKRVEGEAWENLQGKYKELGKTVVDWKYIQSSEWEDKFKSITPAPPVNVQIKNLAEQILKHRQGTFYEDMYVIDANTGKLKGFQTQSKTAFQVDTNDSLRTAFNNAEDNSLIGIHNHPKSSIPSLGDLNAIVSRSSMKQGVIICHDGTIFTYTKPKAIISEFEYERYLTKHNRYSKMTMEDKGFQDMGLDFSFEYRRIE